MEQMQILKGKKILVTGASSGIGRATAMRLAELGAQVVLNGRDAGRLEETRSAMKGEGHFCFVQDFLEKADTAELFHSIISDGKKIDGLVHAAGVFQVVPLKQLTRDRLQTVMDVNFYSFVELTRQFVRKKISNDGSCVIGISSGIVMHPKKCELAYTASKAAMEAAMRVMAIESGNRRIRVNCVAPGNVRTKMVFESDNGIDNDSVLEEAIQRSILGWQRPEDIAEVCAFLLSDAASTITATVIHADGGSHQNF